MKSKILLAAIIIGLLLPAGCGRTAPVDTPQQQAELSPGTAVPEASSPAPAGAAIDYTQYLKKTWVMQKTGSSAGNALSFTIFKIEKDKLRAEFLVIGPPPAYPSNLARFEGTIINGTAECQFDDSRGNQGIIKLSFKAKDEMEASIKLTDQAEDYKAQPPAGTFQFVPYNLKDVDGFSLIEDQSFPVNLNAWGQVKFISGKLTAGNHVPVVFYLTDQDGNILYDFKATLPYRVDVKAVSFADVSNDGLTDILIIVDDAYSGQGGNPLATVYFQKADGTFENDLKLDQEINASGSNKDIKAVRSYLKQYHASGL